VQGKSGRGERACGRCVVDRGEPAGWRVCEDDVGEPGAGVGGAAALSWQRQCHWDGGSSFDFHPRALMLVKVARSGYKLVPVPVSSEACWQ
jgi:hypothetical protein